MELSLLELNNLAKKQKPSEEGSQMALILILFH